jgi:uncharacterized protein YjiS (DUF1127 family)
MGIEAAAVRSLFFQARSSDSQQRQQERLMTHIPTATAFAEGSASIPAARRTGRARAAWQAFWRWRAQQATIRILHTLDDRTLHDIGIGASEIGSCVYGQRGQRMRCYDHTWR